MNPTLFEIPEAPEPRLERARRRLEKAVTAYEQAQQSDEDCDGFGEVAYRELRAEWNAAQAELAAAEAAELARRRATPVA